jgi:hypothetical protein
MNKLILTALFTTIAPAAFASTVLINFTALPGTYETPTYGSTGGTYNGNVPSVIDGVFSVNLVCDDFADTTNVPSGNLPYSVETLANLSGAMFTGGFAAIQEGVTNYTLTQTQAYDTAAVLMTALEGLTVNSANANAITDYQYAIWDLMSPGATDPGTGIKDNADITTTALLQGAFAQVLAGGAPALADEKSLVIYTPISTAIGNQEFLGLNTPVPEPASWAMMAAFGLLLCVPQVRRRLQLSR